MTIEDMVKINLDKGWHFFDEGTMKSFGSQLHGNPIPVGHKRSRIYLFVTSEKGGAHGDPRAYTIRVFDSTTGEVWTYRRFRQHRSYESARQHMMGLATMSLRLLIKHAVTARMIDARAEGTERREWDWLKAQIPWACIGDEPTSGNFQESLIPTKHLAQALRVAT